MKPSEPLQILIDPFVRSFGGEVVSDLIGTNTTSKNADYVFRSHNVIAELKGLEKDSFGESFQRKMGDLTADWHRRGLLIVYGTQRIDISRLHPTCQNEFFDLMMRPFQNNFIAKANKQIEETKDLLSMPTAKGILMVASDGNEDLLPHTVWWLLARVLQKKHPNGRFQFSNIHGLIYFTPRMPVENPQTGEPTVLWHVAPRQSDDKLTVDFLEAISKAWPAHVSMVSGRQFRAGGGKPMDIQKAKFFGITPRMPQIKVNDPEEP